MGVSLVVCRLSNTIDPSHGMYQSINPSTSLPSPPPLPPPPPSPPSPNIKPADPAGGMGPAAHLRAGAVGQDVPEGAV